MKNKRGIVILLVGLVLSFLSAYFLRDTKPDQTFSVAIFSVVCAFLVAAFAFPQLAANSSNSVITKNLLPEFYKQPKYWLFLFYQAFLALLAIFIILTSGSGKTPPRFFHALLFCFVFDFFYGFYYLENIKSLIQKPEFMLKKYREKTKKAIEKSLKKGIDPFIPFIQNIRRMGINTTTVDEKELILNTYDFLLISVGKMKPPLDMININIADQLQLEVWELLVEGISNSCTCNEPHAVNDKNVFAAIEMLKMSWDLMMGKEIKNLDYNIFMEAVARLARFAIKKGFNKSPKKAVEILDRTALDFIPGKPTKNDTLQMIVPPRTVAATIKKIGAESIETRADASLLETIIFRFLHYFKEMGRKELLYLFDVLDLMALMWARNPDLLEKFSGILEDIEESQLEETLKYGCQYFPMETARIRRFFKEIKDFDNPKASTFVLKFKQKYKHLLKQF